MRRGGGFAKTPSQLDGRKLIGIGALTFSGVDRQSKLYHYRGLSIFGSSICCSHESIRGRRCRRPLPLRAGLESFPLIRLKPLKPGSSPILPFTNDKCRLLRIDSTRRESLRASFLRVHARPCEKAIFSRENFRPWVVPPPSNSYEDVVFVCPTFSKIQRLRSIKALTQGSAYSPHLEAGRRIKTNPRGLFLSIVRRGTPRGNVHRVAGKTRVSKRPPAAV